MDIIGDKIGQAVYDSMAQNSKMVVYGMSSGKPF